MGTIDKHFTGILLLIYTVGVFGFVLDTTGYFVRLTPINLFLSAFYLWRSADFSSWLRSWLIGVGVLGFLLEMLGVNTGWIFGNYSYQEALGFKVQGTPLLIGLNWSLVVYASCASLDIVFPRPYQANFASRLTKTIALALAAAFLTTLLDTVMEPVAIAHNFWIWHDQQVPLLNYLSWFFISFLFSMIYFLLEPLPKNYSAPVVYLMQFFFFLVLSFF